MILLISYDLKGHERPSAYEDVRKMIEKNATEFRRPLYSQWFVKTSESVEDWHVRMKSVTDSNDNWFILQVRKPRQGWLDQDVWAWLKKND